MLAAACNSWERTHLHVLGHVCAGHCMICLQLLKRIAQEQPSLVLADLSVAAKSGSYRQRHPQHAPRGALSILDVCPCPQARRCGSPLRGACWRKCAASILL